MRRNLCALLRGGLILRKRLKLSVNKYFKNIELTKDAKPTITVYAITV